MHIAHNSHQASSLVCTFPTAVSGQQQSSNNVGRHVGPILPLATVLDTATKRL